MKRTRLAALFAAVVLGLGGLLSAAGADPPEPSERAAQRHIVVLKESSGDSRQVAAEHSRRYDADIVHVYGVEAPWTPGAGGEPVVGCGNPALSAAATTSVPSMPCWRWPGTEQ